ncbi:Fasciclin arabinogalactan protein 16 [Spatholobus suberectus]|nr:Fasciclin arabinogalactan protein 16 [Spatholobus suberectus]
MRESLKSVKFCSPSDVLAAVGVVANSDVLAIVLVVADLPSLSSPMLSPSRHRIGHLHHQPNLSLCHLKRNMQSLRNKILFVLLWNMESKKKKRCLDLLQVTTFLFFWRCEIYYKSRLVGDGIIHGIDCLLLPRSVKDDFDRCRSVRSITTFKPEVDPRTHSFKKKNTPPAKPDSLPALSIYNMMALGPSLASALVSGLGGQHHHFNGEKQVKDYIQTLLHYGGYNEMADILKNMTSLSIRDKGVNA